MKMRKIEGFGENELDDEFDVNWCYNLMFVVVLCLVFTLAPLGAMQRNISD